MRNSANFGVHMNPSSVHKTILEYGVTVDLADLRNAFETRAANEHAQYVAMDGFEAAAINFQENAGDWEYRLRAQLKGRENPKFYFTPGIVTSTGTHVPPSSVTRGLKGLKLTDGSGKVIQKPFSGNSLDVVVEAASLESSIYRATLYE